MLFRSRRSKLAAAIAAFILLWSLVDWLCRDHDGKSLKQFRFRQLLVSECPELELGRDIAITGKHRLFAQPPWPVVREAASTRPLKIKLNDGTERDIADVLCRIVTYFREKHFPEG